MKKFLGIIIRGTDYTTLKPKGHAIQPSIEMVIEKANEVMTSFKCKKIFLATEDKRNYDRIVEVFGVQNVLTNQKRWIDYKGGMINTYYDNNIRKNDRYISGLEYLSTIYILSKCLYNRRNSWWGIWRFLTFGRL